MRKLEGMAVWKRKPWVRWLVELLVIALIIFGVRAWQHRDMITGEAPDFEQVALNGDTIHLDDYRGKPVLLHFWASWCPICGVEQSSISEISKDWKVITVAYQSGDEGQVQRYVEREGLEHWVTLVDKDGKLAKQYGVSGVPTSYIIDAEGNVQFREIGITSAWGLRLRLWLADLLV